MIVEIEKGDIGAGNGNGASVQTHSRASLSSLPSPPIISITDIPLINRNPPIRQPKSISSFMTGFKSAVNTKIGDYFDENQLQISKYNRNTHFFQPNYQDHVIQNNYEYQNIKNYIINKSRN